MKKLLLFTVFILQAIISHAQFKVCGTVTDSIGGPIEAAVVVLMDPQNSNTATSKIRHHNCTIRRLFQDILKAFPWRPRKGQNRSFLCGRHNMALPPTKAVLNNL